MFILIALLVLSGVDLGDDLLELSLGLALREIVHVVVLRSGLNQPLGFYVGHRPNVVLGCQYELVVQHPLGLVVQTRRGVQLDDLVVLDGQIVAGPL